MRDKTVQQILNVTHHQHVLIQQWIGEQIVKLNEIEHLVDVMNGNGTEHKIYVQRQSNVRDEHLVIVRDDEQPIFLEIVFFLQTEFWKREND